MYKPDELKVEAIKQWLDAGSINIFGTPFSGKDTQAKRLAEILEAHTFGGGDIIRSQSERLAKIVADGSLAPTTEYLDLILPYFSKDEFRGSPLVLSAVGRWHGEEEGVISAAEQSMHPIKAVVFLEISESEWTKRLEESKLRGDRGDRKDDDPDARDKRVREFTNKTLPVIEFYRQEDLLIEIDGNPPEDEVTESIIEKLYKFSLS